MKLHMCVAGVAHDPRKGRLQSLCPFHTDKQRTKRSLDQQCRPQMKSLGFKPAAVLFQCNKNQTPCVKRCAEKWPLNCKLHWNCIKEINLQIGMYFIFRLLWKICLCPCTLHTRCIFNRKHWGSHFVCAFSHVNCLAFFVLVNYMKNSVILVFCKIYCKNT